MTRILILCTGNSCRSQMAEYFLRSLDSTLQAESAGTHPADRVHPLAVSVMEEAGVSMRGATPKHVDQFIRDDFDYVITVCDAARESCPTFAGNVRNRLHISFDDPALATGTDDQILAVFRRVRDEIMKRFRDFYATNLSNPGGHISLKGGR